MFQRRNYTFFIANSRFGIHFKNLKLTNDKCNFLRFIKKQKNQPQKDWFFTQNKSLYDYRNLSTDFTSLSSLLIFLFAKNKNTIEISGNIGSIPFSGKSIPPGKFSNQ